VSNLHFVWACFEENPKWPTLVCFWGPTKVIQEKSQILLAWVFEKSITKNKATNFRDCNVNKKIGPKNM